MSVRNLLLSALLSFAAGTVWADSEIVVAMRYLQPTGTSHTHLYLYRADGKLLRQLTNDDHVQDSNPLFAPDGETIVFERHPDGGEPEFCSVEPRGGHLRRLPGAPAWHVGAQNSAHFDNLEADPDWKHLFTNTNPPPGDPPVHRTPDGSTELVLRVSSADADDDANGEGHGRSYLLRNLQSGEAVPLGNLPGFVGLTNLLGAAFSVDRRFLFEPPLRAAFFGLHLNSTDGDTVFALDLDGKRLVRLSPNWATPFVLSGEPAFLVLAEHRYVPFGDGTRTANCSYVERWGADFKPVRYAKEKAAGICYGASMYRPGKDPAVICILSNAP